MPNNTLEKNVISAMKSCELEGFIYTKEEKYIFSKIALGEISTAQAREIFKKMP